MVSSRNLKKKRKERKNRGKRGSKGDDRDSRGRLLWLNWQTALWGRGNSRQLGLRRPGKLTRRGHCKCRNQCSWELPNVTPENPALGKSLQCTSFHRLTAASPPISMLAEVKTNMKRRLERERESQKPVGVGVGAGERGGGAGLPLGWVSKGAAEFNTASLSLRSY